MEKRSIPHLALTLSGAAVAVAIVVLFIKVNSAATASETPPELDPAELARARSAASAPESPPPPRTITPGAGDLARRTGRLGVPRPLQFPSSTERGAEARSAPALTPTEEAPAAPALRGDPESKIASGTAEATYFYDRGEYESARTFAIQVLELSPDEFVLERMLRIAASSSCFMGDPDQARVYHARLTPKGKKDIEKRCSRVGIEF